MSSPRFFRSPARCCPFGLRTSLSALLRAAASHSGQGCPQSNKTSLPVWVVESVSGESLQECDEVLQLSFGQPERLDVGGEMGVGPTALVVEMHYVLK